MAVHLNGRQRRASEQQPTPQLCTDGTVLEKRRHDSDADMTSDKRRIVDGCVRKFSCPFVKCLPWEKDLPRACRGNGFSSIPRVKEHISRSHLRFCCPTCSHPFETREKRDEHVRERSCQSRKTTDPRYIDENKMDSLRGRTRRVKELKPRQQWFAMYDVLFPNVERPSSPYAEQTTSTASDEVRMIFSRLRPRLVSSLKESLPSISRQDLDAIIKKSFEETLQDYIESPDPPSSSDSNMPSPDYAPLTQRSRALEACLREQPDMGFSYPPISHLSDVNSLQRRICINSVPHTTLGSDIPWPPSRSSAAMIADRKVFGTQQSSVGSHQSVDSSLCRTSNLPSASLHTCNVPDTGSESLNGVALQDASEHSVQPTSEVLESPANTNFWSPDFSLLEDTGEFDFLKFLPDNSDTPHPSTAVVPVDHVLNTYEHGVPVWTE